MSGEYQAEETPQNEYRRLQQEHAQMSLKGLVHAAIQEILAEGADPDHIPLPFAISELQERSTEETLAYMIDLLYSPNVYERNVGAWVLGQMRSAEGDYHAFQDEAVDALIQAIERWRGDPDTLECLGVALGHRDDPRAISPLAALKDHPDARVRFGVVFGLHQLEEPRAVATLLELTADPDAMVRDWATFSFTLIEADTPEIREALFARTQDSDLDIRSEAIEALATRHDPRAAPALLAAIADGANGSPIIDAAIALADPRLYEPVAALRATTCEWNLPSLEEALAACAPMPRL
jgi:HEAT repeat protein